MNLKINFRTSFHFSCWYQFPSPAIAATLLGGFYVKNWFQLVISFCVAINDISFPINLVSSITAIFASVLASAALIASPAFAQQMFPAGGTNSTSCPSGSSYKGSGYCRSNNSAQQFFPAGGSNSTSCPSGSSYVGSGYCKTRWLLIEFAFLRDPIPHWEHLTKRCYESAVRQ